MRCEDIKGNTHRHDMKSNVKLHFLELFPTRCCVIAGDNRHQMVPT